MSQEAAILLCLKISLVSGVVWGLAFVVQYTRLAPWWKDEIGRTVVVLDLLVVLMVLPTIMSLFFSFSRLTSYVAAWTDVGLFGLLTPTMIWRIWVWQRVHKGSRKRPGGSGDGPGHTAAVPVPDGEDGR